MSNRLLVVEPRVFNHDPYRTVLKKKRVFSDILLFDRIEDAVHCIESQIQGNGTVPEKSDCLCLAGGTVMRLFSMLEKASHLVQSAYFFVVCEKPCHACALLADKHEIHGCASRSDKPDDVFSVLLNMVRGHLPITPSMATYVSRCLDRRRLMSRAEHRHLPIYRLTPKEWACYRYLLQGLSIAEIAKNFNIELRSAQNLYNRFLKKMGAENLQQIYRAAYLHGLVDI